MRGNMVEFLRNSMQKETAIALDEKELMKLEEIFIDQDEVEALRFLKRAVYNKYHL